MRRSSLLASVVVAGLMAACASPAPGESNGGTEPGDEPLASQPANGGGGGGGDVPTISTRFFVGGSAHVSVSGHFDIDADVAMNTSASYADGEMTWLQYGDSGSDAPNVLITFGGGDSGVGPALGTYTAIGSSAECSVDVEVTDTSVSGHFSCPEVTAYNSADGSLGTVAIEVDYTADS